MGARGPAPQPIALRRALGQTRPSRVGFDTPEPRDARPAAYPGMSDTAKRIWDHVLKEMPEHVIVAVDRDALRCYCEAMARYIRYQRDLEREGAVIPGKDGYPVKNPLAQVVRDHSDLVRAWARELGLTPAARVGIRLSATARPGGIASELGPPPRMRAVGD